MQRHCLPLRDAFAFPFPVTATAARAALLDNEALREELASGRLRAYLDVFEPEPPPPDDILRRLDNVVLTPHLAGHTGPMYLDCGRRAIEKLRELLVPH